MKKEKFTLAELKVQSFVTNIEQHQMNEVKGGHNVVKGRRHSYITRWTAVDTRTETPETPISSHHQG